MVSTDGVHGAMVARYREAQLHSSYKWAMTTLVTKGGGLWVEGIMPRIAVVDTDASAVIMGRSFAAKFEQCKFLKLDYGATFITASGREDQALGRTKQPINLVWAGGTTEETSILAYAFIADTDAYDLILGMDFLGACFGYVDPLTSDFV